MLEFAMAEKRKDKVFVWCPYCGYHNYFEKRGNVYVCEDCKRELVKEGQSFIAVSHSH